MDPATRAPLAETGRPTFDFEPSVEHLRARRSAKWTRFDDDVLPAWVADTDFDVCPAVRDAVDELLTRGDLGYPSWHHSPLAEPFAERYRTRYGWWPDPAHVRVTTNVVQAARVLIELATEPGDAIAAHAPLYPPFLSMTTTRERRLVNLPVATGDGGIDVDELERVIADQGAKVLLVVNPQNPTGRVLRRHELTALADLAARHDLLVISDEIHAELNYGEQPHIPFASLGDDAAGRTVTLFSASKSFSLAGLRTAVAHVGPEVIRRRWDELPAHLLGEVSVVGVEATLAAWRSGDAWLGELVSHLRRQRDHLTAQLSRLPGVTFDPPEATYLAWLDFRATSLAARPADDLLERARVALNPGTDFGPGGDGHARLIFATGTEILHEMIDRISRVVEQTT